ncbi:MAG TPA: DUF6714 family protein [Pyrinomonadaceae bacterium]|jgi:hypothetical protein
MSDAPEFERRRRELIGEIGAAFDVVSRGGGTTLHEAVAVDDRKSAEELRAARGLDQEARWQDVTDDAISACCSALSFLDERGFRYYIPAFMLYALRHWADGPGGLVSSCAYHLLRLPSESLRQSDPASIAAKFQFTKEQCRAVSRFLRFVVDFDQSAADRGTTRAVERWEQFCARL